MQKIMEFSNFDPAEENLNPLEKSQIRDWVRKYEKYYNFHGKEGLENSGSISKDVLSSLKMNEGKEEDVKIYLETLCTLSEGLSVIMAPDMQFVYNGEDQVQKLRY